MKLESKYKLKENNLNVTIKILSKSFVLGEVDFLQEK